VTAPPPHMSANAVDGGIDASADGGKRIGAIINNRAPPDERPWSQRAEEDYGLTLTDEEKQIFDTCPRGPWSKNVPDRDCTKDAECGDGFCDRGHCAAIHTCWQNLGNRCISPRICYGICIDGRCRSCVSDEECAQKKRELYPNARPNPDARYAIPSTCGPSNVFPGKICY